MLPPLLLVQGTSVSSADCDCMRVADSSLEWIGFIYNDDGEVGESAARSLLRAVDSEGSIEAHSARLKGSYFAVLKRGDDSAVHSFVDPSGLSSAYLSSSVVGSSFLEVANLSGCSPNDIDNVALAELLHLGNVYFGRTLAKSVRKLSPAVVAISKRDGSVETVARPIPSISDAPEVRTIIEALEPVAKASMGKALSVDLTGGVDSRMLATALRFNGVDFETALSGIRGHEDHLLGEAVAETLGVPFHFSEYDAEGITEEDIQNSLVRLDGLGGLIQTNDRLIKLQIDRSERGVATSFKGVGGELYKDFFWIQDFPFLRSRKSRFDRLSRTRLEMELMNERLLTPVAASAYQESRSLRVKTLRDLYSAPINTVSYDNVYYYERVGTWGSRTNTSTQLKGINVHAPLCEPEVVQVGYNAKRRQRFHSMMHRRNIAEASSAASRIMSTDRTRPSPRAGVLAADFNKFAVGKSAKIGKKLGQLLLNRTLYDVGGQRSTADSLLPIRESKAAHDALLILKENGTLRQDVSIEDFSPRFQEHVVVAGYALARLSG